MSSGTYRLKSTSQSKIRLNKEQKFNPWTFFLFFLNDSQWALLYVPFDPNSPLLLILKDNERVANKVGSQLSGSSEKKKNKVVGEMICNGFII